MNIALIPNCPFAKGDKVELPSMRHLGTGRVMSAAYREETTRWLAGGWDVVVKFTNGNVATVRATYLRKV